MLKYLEASAELRPVRLKEMVKVAGVRRGNGCKSGARGTGCSCERNGERMFKWSKRKFMSEKWRTGV